MLADSVDSSLDFCDVEHGNEYVDADGNLKKTGPGRNPYNWISLTVHRRGTIPGGWDPVLAVDISSDGSEINVISGALSHEGQFS
tara:strand:- start:58 stop:312 length:255 start_codon:yes stop_codon:yes gene_type:complete